MHFQRRFITQAKLAVFALALLPACDPKVDETLISYFGSSHSELNEAQRALGICQATAFAWRTRPSLFKNAGFVRTTDERLQTLEEELDATLLTKQGTGVVIQLGGHAGLGGKNRSGCIVGLYGMSPQQSYDLAVPIADHFGAPTNAELGQGLARNAIEVWNLYGEGYIVRIAAYKTWDVLGLPGASVRLVTQGQKP